MALQSRASSVQVGPYSGFHGEAGFEEEHNRAAGKTVAGLRGGVGGWFQVVYED